MTQEKKQVEKATPSVTAELTAVLEEIATEATPVEEKKKGETVTLLPDNKLMVGQREYLLVKDYREGFTPDKLGERFSEVLSRYDYIVGDWGYDQLRLKGFYRATDRKARPEQRIDTLEDYLYEYCNFGCAYFVIERIGAKHDKPQNKRKKKRNNQNKNQAHIAENKGPMTQPKTAKKKPVIKNRKPAKPATISGNKEAKKTTNGNDKKGFVIRKRED
jgi:uncharacterized protein YutD